MSCVGSRCRLYREDLQYKCLIVEKIVDLLEDLPPRGRHLSLRVEDLSCDIYYSVDRPGPDLRSIRLQVFCRDCKDELAPPQVKLEVRVVQFLRPTRRLLIKKVVCTRAEACTLQKPR